MSNSNSDIVDITVQAEDLKRFCSQLYQKVGVPKADADAVAELEVQTDLRGVYSHGTRAVPGYVRSIINGRIKANPDIKIIREGKAFAVLDGDCGLGHVASIRGMKLAIEKAKQVGTGTVAIANSMHFGAAAGYAIMALEHKMIGFATTSTGGASVAAYGGKEAAVGNNPLSYAIPAKEEFPIVLDMACGVSAWGRVGTVRMYGQKLTEGWALDENGQPTDDPAKARVMLPAGGTKGYGLAVVMSVLAGVLVGGKPPINKIRGQSDTEHFFYAIDISSFTDYDEFAEEMAQMIRKIRSTKPADGFSRVYLPGEIEWLKYNKQLKEGISLHKDHLASLANIAKELEVEVFWE